MVRIEWIELTSLRSTWESIAGVALLSLGPSALFASIMVFSVNSGGDRPAGVGSGIVLGPTQFTMLLAGALGAIVVPGTYATGMIRSTLTAVPRRGMVVASSAGGRSCEPATRRIAYEASVSRMSLLG